MGCDAQPGQGIARRCHLALRYSFDNVCAIQKLHMAVRAKAVT